MIFDSMPLDKILEEVHKDFYLLIPKRNQLTNLYKQKHKGTEQIFEYKTSRGNIYEFLYVPRPGGHEIYIYTKCQTDFGKKIILIGMNLYRDLLESVYIFDPHVFRRYKERFLKKDLTKVAIMKELLTSMSVCASIVLDENKEEIDFNECSKDILYNVYSHLDTGALLGDIMITNRGYIVILKTFVPTDMLYQDQIDMSLSVKENYDILNKAKKIIRRK